MSTFVQNIKSTQPAGFMKKLFIISLTLAFGLVSLWAEDKPAKKERKPSAQRGAPPNREAILNKFDQDGDGKLSEEERAEVRKSFSGGRSPRPPAALIKRFDKDGDGKVTRTELRERRLGHKLINGKGVGK